MDYEKYCYLNIGTYKTQVAGWNFAGWEFCRLEFCRLGIKVARNFAV
jgi:hypothetical protein